MQEGNYFYPMFFHGVIFHANLGSSFVSSFVFPDLSFKTVCFEDRFFMIFFFSHAVNKQVVTFFTQ